MNGEMEENRKRDAFIFVIGLAAGIIITLMIVSLTGSPDRFALVASQDGSVVHKIDTETGRIWWKNSYVEMDAQGQPVTIWYWEELTLDRPGASRLAKDVKTSTSEVQKAEEELMAREEKEKNALKQKRLDEIYNICGEDMECVKKKCAVGYKGANDPKWSAYCTDSLKVHIADVIIEQCVGDSGCIKSYCINKYNNTYPAVSDCVSDINLQKVKSENTKSENPEEEPAE